MSSPVLTLIELFARFERMLDSFERLSKGNDLDTENARNHMKMMGDNLAEMANRLTLISCQTYVKPITGHKPKKVIKA